MKSVRSSSTKWRATCSFPTYKSDIYRDYVRAQLKDIDILEFRSSGECSHVEFINLRDHKGLNTTVPFWQEKYPFHTDSFRNLCQFDARNGSLWNEDNFGFYSKYNPDFRCTESDDSTTQYWFGWAIAHRNAVWKMYASKIWLVSIYNAIKKRNDQCNFLLSILLKSELVWMEGGSSLKSTRLDHEHKV